MTTLLLPVYLSSYFLFLEPSSSCNLLSPFLRSSLSCDLLLSLSCDLLLSMSCDLLLSVWSLFLSPFPCLCDLSFDLDLCLSDLSFDLDLCLCDFLCDLSLDLDLDRFFELLFKLSFSLNSSAFPLSVQKKNNPES